MKNKYIYLHDQISTNQYDLAIFTETWLGTSETDDTCINGLVPCNYRILRADRTDGRQGGGLALIHKKSLDIRCIDHMKYDQFESMLCTMLMKDSTTLICVIYRPPPSIQNDLTTPTFLIEWENFLSQHVTTNAELLIIGDLKLHLDKCENPHTRNFNHILGCNGLQQHVNEATHYMGHILDVIISRDTSVTITNTEVQDIGLCDNYGKLTRDHYAIICTLEYPHVPESSRQLVSYRNFRSIDVINLRHDIRSSAILNDTNGTVDELTDRYINGLSSVIDIHAPLQQKYVTIRPHAPWYTDKLREEKRKRRKLERIWRHRKLEADRQKYRKQCVTVAHELVSAKTTFYTKKITECNGNSKSLYKITEKLLVNQHQQTLPTHQCEITLANAFSDFFEDKISNIRKDLDIIENETEHALTQSEFKDLRPTSSDEIRSIIMSYANKSCELDPIPTWLLKQCLSELLPLITTIMNLSLSSG